jgi:hypothetical protein
VPNEQQSPGPQLRCIAAIDLVSDSRGETQPARVYHTSRSQAPHEFDPQFSTIVQPAVDLHLLLGPLWHAHGFGSHHITDGQPITVNSTFSTLSHSTQSSNTTRTRPPLYPLQTTLARRL